MLDLFIAQDAPVWADLLSTKNIIPIVAIVFGCTIGLVAVISGAITSLSKARAKEASRREIAAYVAEGSLTPEQGIALMDAGKSAGDKNCMV